MGTAEILGALATILTTLFKITYDTNKNEEQKRYNWSATTAANQMSWEQWNATNEYNTPANQIQRERDAGLNPLYYGLDGSSANAFQSVQPLSYTPHISEFANPLLAGLDAANKFADTDKKRAEASATALDNEFKQLTMKTRARAEELKNEISEEEKKSIIQKRDLVAEEIRKTANEADNEFEKKTLIQAETRLRNASADEILALIPYKKLNLEADTLAKKAAASAAFWSAAKDKKFVELGGVEKQIEECQARIDKLAQEQKTSEAQEQAAKAKAALDEWKNCVQTGHVFDYIIEDPNANWLERELAGFFNGVFNVGSMVTTTVGNILPKF